MLTKDEKNAQAALFKSEIRYLLIPYYATRMQVEKVKRDKHGQRTTQKFTYYAHEHTCSYAQCVGGHVSSILLSRLQGYNNLLQLIDSIGNDLQKAVIYQRPEGSASFDNLLNRWYRNANGVLVLEKENPHGYDDSSVLELQYQVVGQRLVIVPPEHEELINELRNKI